MNFLLAGFDEGNGSRRFAFQCVAADHSKRTVIVGADMVLARKHAIRLQELPLICVRLLESLGEDELTSVITLTEDHMKAIQAESQNTVARKQPKRGKISREVGQAWRNLR